MSADPNDEERFGYPDLTLVQGHECNFIDYYPLDDDGKRIPGKYLMCEWCGQAGYEIPPREDR